MTDFERAAADLNKAWETVHNAALDAAEPPYEALGEMASMIEDALLWRALMQTPRFRVQGSAGLSSDGTIDPDSGRDYVHFGMEAWSAYRTAPEQVEAVEKSNARARNMLRSLAEMNMRGADPATGDAVAALDEDQRMYGRAIMFGLEVRQVIRLLPEVGLGEAIKQSCRPEMDYGRTLTYLQMKGMVLADPMTPEGVRLSRVGEDMHRYLMTKFDESEFAEAEAAILADAS